MNTLNDTNTTKTNSTPRKLNAWLIYGICFLISSVFFFLFGFNSPIFVFNSDIDYNWFMTMGRGLLAGKLPYRDLFEQKGPLVYLATAFCCLFQNPNLVMLFIEIICMSLFFFFAYRIARKNLNTFYSLILVSILAVAIFTNWCSMGRASIIEEFCLPIYAYFLMCWLEFITEHKNWHWIRALCLGLCFGIIIWSKYTLIYFMVAPTIIWFVLSLRTHNYRHLICNLIMMLIGLMIITLPNLIFYAINHALDDLFHIYFTINMTAYETTTISAIIKSFLHTFLIGPLILFLIIWGVVRFTIHHWRENTGKLLLIAFCVNWGLLLISAKGLDYYFSELFPYAILGVIDILIWISHKFTLPNYRQWLYLAITGICLIICIPCSPLTYEWGRNKDNYTPLVIADVIHQYETDHHTTASLYCYKLFDFGFYNALGTVPNNYYYALNNFSEDNFPAMYQGFHDAITDQSTDFVITFADTWHQEKTFLEHYYQPYTYTSAGEPTVYHYKRMGYFYYRNYDFVLLHKI